MTIEGADEKGNLPKAPKIGVTGCLEVSFVGRIHVVMQTLCVWKPVYYQLGSVYNKKHIGLGFSA